MSRETTIVTPENIPLTLELAGLGSRFSALTIDLLVQSALISFGVTILSVAAALLDKVGLEWLGGVGAIVYSFLVFFGYFIFLETNWNGQTVGKRAMGLRVVREGGYPITFYAAATRNLIRTADFLPLGYGVGALCVFLSPQYKRLGDLVAGTVVIKEREARFLNAVFVDTSAIRMGAATGGTAGGLETNEDKTATVTVRQKRTAYRGPRLPDSAHNPFDILRDDELELLRRFSSRRWEMLPDDAERMAYRLVAPLVPRLNVTFLPNVAPRYADLASVIVGTADLTAAEREETAGARL
ncbi:MAG: RDD family protein [Cytophagales bacterium]|nr:RDD family protein [Armatimonadota bacterium]